MPGAVSRRCRWCRRPGPGRRCAGAWWRCRIRRRRGCRRDRLPHISNNRDGQSSTCSSEECPEARSGPMSTSNSFPTSSSASTCSGWYAESCLTAPIKNESSATSSTLFSQPTAVSNTRTHSSGNTAVQGAAIRLAPSRPFAGDQHRRRSLWSNVGIRGRSPRRHQPPPGSGVAHLSPTSRHCSRRPSPRAWLAP